MTSNCQKITHFGRGYPEISSYDQKWPRSELVFSLQSFGCRWPQNCTVVRPERYIPKTYGIRNREEQFSTERREKPFSPRFFANRSFERLPFCDSLVIKRLGKRIRYECRTTKAPFLWSEREMVDSYGHELSSWTYCLFCKHLGSSTQGIGTLCSC